jgi:hypothetical protein
MNLFNKFDEKSYGPYYRDHLLDQYKIMVESAEKVSDRRNLANSFYLGINTAIFSIVGLSLQLSELTWIRPLLYLTGILLSIVFYLLINSYKQLNSGKFKVIHKIEQKLPLSIYAYEWEVLGKGKNKKLYYPFSHVELLIPVILGTLYLIFLTPYISSLISSFCRT